MLNLARYGTMAALAVGIATAATKPASAWGYGGYDPNYGYGYGAFASGYPEVYGMTYPNGYAYLMTYPGGSEGYYRPYGYYRPFRRHHYYGLYGPGRFYWHRW
jgi:hypothetical protein